MKSEEEEATSDDTSEDTVSADSVSTTSTSPSSESVSEEHDEEDEDEDEEEAHEPWSFSEAETDTHDILGWYEGEDTEGGPMPSHNPYIDESTMNVRFNTEHHDSRDRWSAHIVRNYTEFTKKHGQAVCQLKHVLVDVIPPDDASHLIVTFCNFSGDQFSVPYALSHREDAFPCEDTRLVTDCALDELPRTLIMIHRPHPQGPPVEENLTAKMIHLCWKHFHPGFYRHRPYAWSWLTELSDDPEAVLQAKYEHDCFASMKLSDAQLFVYSV